MVKLSMIIFQIRTDYTFVYTNTFPYAVLKANEQAKKIANLKI